MLLTIDEKEYLQFLLGKRKKKMFLSKFEKEMITSIQQKTIQTSRNEITNHIRERPL